MSYNLITKFDSPNFTRAEDAMEVYKRNRTIEGITIHHWDDVNKNPSFEGTVNTLIAPGAGKSAHVVATGTSRRVAWLVNAEDVAWHAGNGIGNTTTIGIECDPRCRDEDYDVVAELIADIWRTYGKLKLYRHKDWIITSCPGNWDIERLRKLAEAKLSGGDGGMATMTREQAVTLKNVMRVLNSEAKGWDRIKTHRGDYDEKEIAYLMSMGVNAVEAIARYSQQAWDEGGSYRRTKDTWKAAFDEKSGYQKQITDLTSQVTKLKEQLANMPGNTTEAEKKLEEIKKALNTLKGIAENK